MQEPSRGGRREIGGQAQKGEKAGRNSSQMKKKSLEKGTEIYAKV
jgi:hypothetical protein